MFEGLFQPAHLLVIFGIALLVFGPKKLPNSAKASGRVSAASSQPSKKSTAKVNIIAGDQN